MTTLLVDNYDSYTYNVFHLLAAVCGEEPIVVHNDMVSWRALSRWDFDAIVLSPGPGRPDRWHDFGVCSDILRSSEIPVLGICLGHQGLGRVLSGLVATAPRVMHGRLSQVQHVGSGLFQDVPQDFSVVRYHSLAVTGPFGPEGRVTAWTSDGVVMGIEHCHRPLWGVQFHPESVATEHGRTIVENFYALARRHSAPRASRAGKPATSARRPRPARRARARGVGEAAVKLHLRSLAGEPSTELLFERLFGAAEHAFWLDSADAPTRLAQCSYLGTSAGADRCVLEYDVEHGRVTKQLAAGSAEEYGSIFDVLDRELCERAIEPPAGSPRGLLGGFVGYLGYECKADCGSPNVHRSDVPDAVFMFANRLIAVDHARQRTYLLALSRDGEANSRDGEARSRDGEARSRDGEELGRNGEALSREGEGLSRDGEADAERWLEEAEACVRAILETPPNAPPQPTPADATTDTAADAGVGGGPVTFHCGRGREQYLADILRCQAELTAGESYEVCLTDQISTAASPEPFALYRLLRRRNPAPFAAYLKLGELAVLSSSPERFLAVDSDRNVQARPIKGTAPRSSDPTRDAALGAELTQDEKTFAEHLMIVDLLRNDLGRVCELDSVRVPEFMTVESYPTVHQLISTITGVLEPERTPVDCVRACFPGGSMTGAPKLRTMGIIDDIERVARGVYSGALGYFGLDGAVDLSIVIRTIVLRPSATTIGAGGAIVIQSDPEEEFDELLLKARAPMAAIAHAVTGSDAPEAWTVALEPSAAMAGAV
jgi:para-aminobenzoate synthetase